MNIMVKFVDWAREKTVYVRAYLRFRYGKWEDVTSHYRRPPH